MAKRVIEAIWPLVEQCIEHCYSEGMVGRYPSEEYRVKLKETLIQTALFRTQGLTLGAEPENLMSVEDILGIANHVRQETPPQPNLETVSQSSALAVLFADMERRHPDPIDMSVSIGPGIAKAARELRYPHYSDAVVAFDAALKEAIPPEAQLKMDEAEQRMLDADLEKINQALEQLAVDPSEQQKLKLMLCHGTREQMFQAAKFVRLIPSYTPETDETYERLKLWMTAIKEALGKTA
jgi:hypothetical protein